MASSIAEAVELVRTICLLPGNNQFLKEVHGEAKAAGLSRAIQTHNTPALYDWLMSGFSFQGISDRIAGDYIDRHGNSSWRTIESMLADHRCKCPKLSGFDTYRDCGYRKTAGTCRNSAALPDCPVPALPLRKGDLNQLAFSLHYFLRDRCQGDLVSFINGIFAAVDEAGLVDPIKAKRDRLLAEFSVLHAVSAKLIAMMLSSLLMAAGARRPDWLKVGRSLVTIDSLVHNFLHRTGILVAFDQVHGYGPACHGPRGCATVIYQLADRIDAREVNRAYPKVFPRFIEFAIWAFCAETRADICNGRRIDDRFPCTRTDCPVGSHCARLPLRPSPSDEVFHGQAAKSRREQPRPLPFRQGNLDGLCGIYALINAVRLVTAEQLDLSNGEWAGVFARLLAVADDDRGIAKVVTGGIGTRPLIALARAAIDHLAKHYGIELTISRPLHDEAKLCRRELVAKLHRLVGLPGSAILIGIGGHVDHWSVVRSVGDCYLGLFDSSGFHRIRIDRCRTRHEKKLGTAVEHVLHPAWIFRLAVEN